MNLPRAVADHGQSALEDIDRHITECLARLAELHSQRVTVAMHMAVSALTSPTEEGE
jgi:hypothetical protein